MSEDDATQEIRRRYSVPDGLGLHVDRRQVLAWLPGSEGAVRRVALDPAGLAPAAVAGRAPLARLPGADGALLVRSYRKGGLLRRLRGRRFLGRLRPLDELVLHHALTAAHVPVPAAMGCVVLKGPLGWRGYLLVGEVSPAQDLEAFLYGAPGPVRTSRGAVLQDAGRVVRMLHDAGVAHADLHPKNLLVDAQGSVLVLDLDRARRFPGPVPDRARLGNLVRLGRAIEKHRLKGMRSGRREALRFLEGYAGSRSAAVDWLERIRGRLGRGLGLRMLWWRLTGATRPWRGGETGP